MEWLETQLASLFGSRRRSRRPRQPRYPGWLRFLFVRDHLERCSAPTCTLACVAEDAEFYRWNHDGLGRSARAFLKAWEAAGRPDEPLPDDW